MDSWLHKTNKPCVCYMWPCMWEMQRMEATNKAMNNDVNEASSSVTFEYFLFMFHSSHKQLHLTQWDDVLSIKLLDRLKVGQTALSKWHGIIKQTLRRHETRVVSRPSSIFSSPEWLNISCILHPRLHPSPFINSLAPSSPSVQSSADVAPFNSDDFLLSLSFLFIRAMFFHLLLLSLSFISFLLYHNIIS